MASFSQVIQARTVEYSEALRLAKADYELNTGSQKALAYQALLQDSDYSDLAPTNSNFFADNNPTAGLEEINRFNDWLAANPDYASHLNLAVQVRVDSSSFTDFGETGVIGPNKRRWKGQQVYTFGNGTLIGKDQKLIAAFGHIPDDVPYVGDDTLIFFDGIPNTRGTSTPGVTAFGGDVVISGSLQGMNGVITINDVIQLETGVTNPAAIGVDDSGVIHLRNRGAGFRDLVDQSEVDTQVGALEETLKTWVGSQNTSSTRWGMSLIPNSNFSLKEIDYVNGTPSEKPAGVMTIGNNANEVEMAEDGICSFNGNGKGVLLPAIPLEVDATGAVTQRFAVRIRVWGNIDETVENDGEAEGLFVAIMETSDEDIGEASHIYDPANPNNPGALYDPDYSVHSTNVSLEILNPITVDAGGFEDGAPIPGPVNGAPAIPEVKSYVYTPTAGTKNISLAIWARNYNSTVHLDYCIMNELPTLAADVAGLVEQSVQAIDDEDTTSLVEAAGMNDSTAWEVLGTATVTDDPDGGDSHTQASPDAAVIVNCLAPGDGIVSSGIGIQGSSYTVGIRLKLASGQGPVGVTVNAYETSAGNQAISTGYGPHITNPNQSDIVGIPLIEFDASNAETGENGYTIQVGDDWSTLLGTYEVSGGATVSSSPSTTTGLLSLSTDVAAQAFSIAIQADDACDLIVDYVYVVQQSISANLAEAYADAAYAGSEGFVTAINELLIKEQGSILPNASMALYDDLGPSGYSVKDGTMQRVTDANDDVQIQVTGTGAKLLTPSFVLGEADKFSIAVRIRSLVGGTNTCRISVNWKSGLLQSGETSISNETGWTRTVGTADDVHEFDIDQDADTNTDPALSNAYPAVGLLMTWNREELAPTADIASIMIECDESFEVDYILVKEQIVSYSLAEATAEGKAAETYESLVNDLERVNEDLDAETNSLISNAGFMSYVVQGQSGSEYQHPKKWVNTYNAGPLVRIVKSSEGGTYTDPFGNNVTAANGEEEEDVGQDDACLKLEGSIAGTRGVLSEKWQIPPNTSSEFTGGDGSTQTASSTGNYVISAQVRQNSAQTVYVSIIAHESTSFTSPSEKYLFDTSPTGATVGTPVNTNHSVASSGVTARPLQVVNLSSASNSSAVTTNWVNIGATYTPGTDVQHVSFEFRYSTPSAATELYIDYVYLAPQILGTDFAEAFASSLLTTIDAVQQTDLDNLEASLRTEFPGYSDLTDLYTDVINENQSLISNGNFEQTVDANGVEYARNWISGTSDDGYKFPIQVQANGSIGSYIATPAGASYARIISKAIVNPMVKITQSDGRRTAFNFAVRLRGKNQPLNSEDSKQDFTVRVYAYESTATANSNSYVTNTAPADLTDFGLTRISSNDYQQLSLVDLALENPDAETILPVRQLEQDANEDVADWRVIAGSYVPTNEQVTMVSFHVYIVLDDGNDGTKQTVFIDSITLDVASVSLDLATEIAQDEADESTRISKNSNPGGNLIDNGRFDIVAGTRGNRYPDDWSIKLATSQTISDTLKYPTVGTLLNQTQYKHVKFFASDDDPANYDYLMSRPFRILEDDYKVNVSIEASTGNDYLNATIYMLETSVANIDPDGISCIWAGSFGTSNMVLVDEGTYQANTSSKTLVGSVNLYDGVSQSLEYDYEPTDGANWASFVIEIKRADSTTDNVLIKRISCRPDTASSSRKLVDRGILDAGKFGLADFANKTFLDIGNGFLSSRKAASRATSTFDFDISPSWNLRTLQDSSAGGVNKLNFIYTTSNYTTVVRGYISGGYSVNNNDILNFTGQHRCEDFNDDLTNESIGLIVVSTGFYNNLQEKDRPTINSALPIVELADSRNQKSVFGVLSKKEDRDGNPREYSYGAFVTVQDDPEDLDRLIINSLGEGAIWVCNINGNLENGDYITSCEIPGHGMKQDDDLLHNYTVAKITQDCNFELDNPYYDCIEFEHEGTIYKKAFVGCTYHCG